MAEQPSPSPPQAILFDLDGTLYHQAPLRRAMAVRLAFHALRHPVRGLDVLRALRAYRQAHELLRPPHPPPRDLGAAQLQLAASRSGIAPNTVAALVARWMETEPLSILPGLARPGLHECLRALTRQGIRLAIVSDYPVVAKLDALGVAEFFPVQVSAQDPAVQRLKPDPRGLEVAMERLGVRPEQSWYVGDRPDVDAEAATRAGMAGIILGDRAVAPPAVSIRDLRSLQELVGRPPSR